MPGGIPPGCMCYYHWVAEYSVPLASAGLIARFCDAVRNNPPVKVGPDWLMGQLGSATLKTARNQFGELKRLGLLNEEGRLTEGALKLRTDDHFKEGCDWLLSEGFPDDMIQAFAGRIPEEREVINYLIAKGKGQAVASQAASLFTFLKTGIPTEVRAYWKIKSKREESARFVSSSAATLPSFEAARQHQSGEQSPVPSATETLRYRLGEGRTAELRIPADITKTEMRRLMKHIKLDLEEVEE